MGAVFGYPAFVCNLHAFFLEIINIELMLGQVFVRNVHLIFYDLLLKLCNSISFIGAIVS